MSAAGENLCRTSNMEKMRFYLKNQDVVKGVSLCATLQFSTYLLCAALDGYVWRVPEEVHLIPKLGIHPNCRCVHLPVTDMDDINRSTRPAEASDFWRDAAVRYAKKYPVASHKAGGRTGSLPRRTLWTTVPQPQLEPVCGTRNADVAPPEDIA